VSEPDVEVNVPEGFKKKEVKKQIRSVCKRERERERETYTINGVDERQ
jgi:hypothetical protein